MSAAVSVGVAAGIGAVCFLLGFVLRHFCTATSDDPQKVTNSQYSNPLAAVFVPVKPVGGSVSPFAPGAEHPENQTNALGPNPSTAQHGVSSTIDGEECKHTAQRRKQLGVVDKGGTVPREATKHSVKLPPQHSTKLPPSETRSHTIDGTSAHGGSTALPFSAAATHVPHASAAQLERTGGDSQQALDDELCGGTAQRARHAPQPEAQNLPSDQQSEHSSYYSSTSRRMHSPDSKPGPSQSRQAPSTQHAPCTEATSGEPPAAAGKAQLEGSQAIQAPEEPARPSGSISNLISIQTASTNMRSMRSMWSCMGNVQRVVGPVVYCMQASASSIKEGRARLHALLDELCVRGHPVGGKLLLLEDDDSRRVGGHSTVQIAQHTATHVTYALKFFLCPATFQRAKTLYTDSSKPLGHFLPAMARMHEAGELTGMHGDALPACIIMQPGESLDLYMRHKGHKLDLITCLKVLCHASGCLRVLHGAGYVHRDVRPGSLMWMPRKRHWTLIGFACATSAYSKAALTYNIAYAAPEVLKAVLDGEETMRVTPAVDAWALGIVAIELLSGEPVLGRNSISTEQAVGMIVGRKTAPWEDRNSSTAALLTPLGEVKAIVLRLLCRDPKRRMTMEQCFEACLPLLKQSTQRASGHLTSRSRSDFQEQLFRADGSCTTHSDSDARVDAPKAVTPTSATLR